MSKNHRYSHQCEHRIKDVATPGGYARDHDLVHQFYNMRHAQSKEVAPNAAHLALARLAAEWEGDLHLVTQNVDDLHARYAWHRWVDAMHGLEGPMGQST